MARVIYSEAALADLERIIEFTLEREPALASRALDVIRTAVEALERHPLIGRRVDPELRELVISRARTGYVALYRYDVLRDCVMVLRLRSQREAGYRE